MIDLPTPTAVALFQPADHTIEKRKRSSGDRRAIVVGAIILLPDVIECRVEGFDAQGNPLCYPLPSP